MPMPPGGLTAQKPADTIRQNTHERVSVATRAARGRRDNQGPQPDERDFPAMQEAVLPVFLFVACVVALCVGLLVLGNLFNPGRRSRVKQMPYESGMDPIHDTRRRFDVRFHLLAIAFLVFDVELLFLYPWAVTARPAKQAALEKEAALEKDAPDKAADEVSGADAHQAAAVNAVAEALRGSPAGCDYIAHRRMVFAGVIVFLALLTLGFIYDWRKGIFRWR
jgi:NADH-quinone oxidoreductase subunit A